MKSFSKEEELIDYIITDILQVYISSDQYPRDLLLSSKNIIYSHKYCDKKSILRKLGILQVDINAEICDVSTGWSQPGAFTFDDTQYSIKNLSLYCSTKILFFNLCPGSINIENLKVYLVENGVEEVKHKSVEDFGFYLPYSFYELSDDIIIKNEIKVDTLLENKEDIESYKEIVKKCKFPFLASYKIPISALSKEEWVGSIIDTLNNSLVNYNIIIDLQNLNGMYLSLLGNLADYFIKNPVSLNRLQLNISYMNSMTLGDRIFKIFNTFHNVFRQIEIKKGD